MNHTHVNYEHGLVLNKLREIVVFKWSIVQFQTTGKTEIFIKAIFLIFTLVDSAGERISDFSTENSITLYY